MNQPHNTQHIKPNDSLDIVKAHDVLQRYIAELFKLVANDPNMPNGTSIRKAADCIGRLSHSFVDYRQHNSVLLEENRELYRQLELRSVECDAYLDEISNLQSQLQHWRDYYAANADLFAPPINMPYETSMQNENLPHANNETNSHANGGL